MKIYLVGFMASGKSFLGKHLAESLGCDFLDLDAMIEKGEGRSISQIFEESGEGVFRDLESRYLKKTQNLKRTIISTGGGTPCFAENMDWMNEVGITIYLKASTEKIAERLKKEKSKRPLVAQKDGKELEKFIADLLEKRESFYQMATFVCNANLDLDKILPDVKHYFGRFS